MSRTVNKYHCSNPIDSEIIVQKILSTRGYQRKEENGEVFYQNGSSLFAPPKCIRYSFEGDVLTLEGWVRPFNMSSESELNGAVCNASKKQCLSVFNEIHSHLNVRLFEGSDGSFPYQNTPDSESHTLELVIGIILALISPLVGFIASLYFFLYKKYDKSNRDGGIVVLVAFANWMLGMFVHFLGII